MMKKAPQGSSEPPKVPKRPREATVPRWDRRLQMNSRKADGYPRDLRRHDNIPDDQLKAKTHEGHEPKVRDYL